MVRNGFICSHKHLNVYNTAIGSCRKQLRSKISKIYASICLQFEESRSLCYKSRESRELAKAGIHPEYKAARSPVRVAMWSKPVPRWVTSTWKSAPIATLSLPESKKFVDSAGRVESLGRNNTGSKTEARRIEAECDLLGIRGTGKGKGAETNPLPFFIACNPSHNKRFNMLDKLAEVETRYEELERLMSDPQLLNQQREYSKLAKERSELEEIVSRYREWRKVEQEIQENRQLLEENDEAIRELAKEEVGVLRQRKEDLENRLKFLILPKDPNDNKNVIIEIRAGTGGDEAALFAGELYRMYTRYAESRGWRVEILSSNPTGLGGFKEIIMMVEGKGAYSRLKFEGGVHRVQRVPVTEGSGRIHTSAVTVAVHS
jgi:hypothetical protein